MQFKLKIDFNQQEKGSKLNKILPKTLPTVNEFART